MRQIVVPHSQDDPHKPLVFDVYVEPFGSKRLIVALYTTIEDEDGETLIAGDTQVLSLN